MSKPNRVVTILAGMAVVAAYWYATDRPARADDKVGGGAAQQDADATRPCGTYDIKKLGDHFRVTVETRKLSTGHYEVAITMDGKEGDEDTRKPFPTDRMRLTVLDGKGGTQLETPIQWSKGKGRFTDGGGEPRASLVVAPAMAARLVLMTPPGVDTLFSPPGHVVVVGFGSLAD